MIIIGHPCEKCKHIHSNLIDGWNVACDAFPKGFPKGFPFNVNVTELEECNNGIKFEPIDE